MISQFVVLTKHNLELKMQNWLNKRVISVVVAAVPFGSLNYALKQAHCAWSKIFKVKVFRSITDKPTQTPEYMSPMYFLAGLGKDHVLANLVLCLEIVQTPH